MSTVVERPVTIIQFTKSPEGENVKTRMSPTLNAEQRLTLHKAMTQRAFQEALFSQCSKVIIAVDGNIQNAFFDTLHDNVLEKTSVIDIDGLEIASAIIENKPMTFVSQQGDNLGRKMFLAASNEMQLSAYESSIILIGSDCPFLSSEYIDAAIDALSSVPVVIGPAKDGGYVLLGMRKIIPSLFENIPWGSDMVFKKTCEAMRYENIKYKELNALNDIDRPEDLALLSMFSEESDDFKAYFKSIEV